MVAGLAGHPEHINYGEHSRTINKHNWGYRIEEMILILLLNNVIAFLWTNPLTGCWLNNFFVLEKFVKWNKICARSNGRFSQYKTRKIDSFQKYRNI